MERLTEQVILTLAKTIDAKDKYTKGHSERVAAYSGKIAVRMQLSEENIPFKARIIGFADAYDAMTSNAMFCRRRLSAQKS